MIGANLTTQALSFGLFGALGIFIGIIFWLWLKIRMSFVPNFAIRFLIDFCICISWGIAFFVVEICFFDYDLRSYHIATTIATALISYWIIYRLTLKNYDLINQKLFSIATKLKNSKLGKFFKK